MLAIRALILLAVFLPLCVFAQLERSGTPISWNQELTVPVANEWVGEANVELLMEEDAAQGEDRSVPYRFAYAREVSWNMLNSGSWFNLANGDRLWILGIAYEGAQSIAVTFNHFQIPQGGKLFVYSEDRIDYLGPLTEADNRNNELGLPHIRGQKIYLEYYEPRARRGEGSLEVGHVSGSYRNHQSEATPLQSCALWISESNQVVSNVRAGSSLLRVLLDHGQRYATGVLVNNALNNAEPFVIVPSQALAGGASSMVFQFGLNDPDCFDQALSCELQTICGADVICLDPSSGLALLRMHKAPPAEWNAYYAGWNIDNSIVGSHYCFQHPKGLAKSYSVYESAFMPVVLGDFEYLGLAGTGEGQTDVGSVGSPLLDSDWNVVGIFMGGNSRCTMAGGMDQFVLLEDVWMTFRQFLDPSQSSTDKIPGMESPPADIASNDPKELIIYPNPAWQTFSVLDSEAEGVEYIEIYDALGRMRLKARGGSSVEVSQLTEGVYTLRIVTKGGTFSRSLFVTKK